MVKRIAVSVMLAAAGCSAGPQSEKPVELQPGLYSVTIGGGTLLELASGGTHADVCFETASAAGFSSQPLSNLVESGDGCSDDIHDPKGNALGGVRRCDRKMPVVIAFTGRHATDSFELHGTVAQGSDESGGILHLGSGDFTIAGKRIGECLAG